MGSGHMVMVTLASLLWLSATL